MPSSLKWVFLRPRWADCSLARYDPIVDEVRAIREAYAESLGNDPAAIIADLRERQLKHADRLVSLSPNYLSK